MKNSRLFQILYLLMERRELTASWLSEKLEVSQRTIYRDIDALSAAGIPVYCQKGKGGGIRLMEQFRMDRSLLDEKEQDSLLFALKTMEATGALDSSALISRLSGLFQKQPSDWVEIDFDNWGSRPAEKTCFEQCRQAILNRTLLTFRYYNSSGEVRTRTVEPVRLCYKGANWYLYAYCLSRNDFRLFRLNRIQSLECLKDTFLPRPLPQKEPDGHSQIFTSRPEMVSLVIRFTPRAAYRVTDFFLPEEIETFPDGSTLVRTSFPPGSWIMGFLLTFGKEALVLEPEWLRGQLKKEAEEIQKLYNI